ncbi:MAG: hypothetical protein GY711_34965 [bacterium]|nr:hypothetical protein [bacterium]
MRRLSRPGALLLAVLVSSANPAQARQTDAIWAVGGTGTILNSVDDGLTWTAIPPFTSQALNDVDFPTQETGYIVGSGTALKTTDGGANWSQVLSTGYVLHAVAFVSATRGWAVGTTGTILRTTDGGGTWSTLVSGTNFTLRDVFFANASTGWVVGTNVILKTSNGGASWSAQYFGQVLNQVHFEGNAGLAVGNTGGLLRSSNGGATWSSDPLPTSFNLTGIHFVDGSRGWISGDHEMYRTTDAGASWTDTYDGGASLADVVFRNASVGWAVGSTGTILRSSSGGVSWSSRTSGTNAPLHAVIHVPGSTPVYSLTMTAETGGNVNPPNGSYAAGTQVSISATPLPGFSFSGWTGSGSGSYTGMSNPAVIVMNGPITQTGRFTATPLVIVYVDANAPPGGNGSASAPVRTVSQGAALVTSGGIVSIASGSYDETFAPLDKPLTLKATGGTVVIGK